MSRQRAEIHPIRAERVKILMKRERITQTILAKRIFQSQQNVSRIMQLKQPLIEETARKIIEAFPEYRLQWLLGYDDYMTREEWERGYIQRQGKTDSAAMTIIDAAIREVCAREGIEPLPVINNPAEYAFLEAQLLDFADSIVLNYIKHRQYSHVWNLIDHDCLRPDRRI